jgi:hypothetical protein
MSHNFYPDNSFGYGLFGALCTSFCLYFSIKGIQDTEDFTNSIPEKLKFGTAPIFTLAVITFISFIIITTNLTILYSNIKENELKQFGKITTGEIIEGYSLTDQHNFGSYNVTVEYKLNGETITAFTKVSSTEFTNCYVGKEVNLIYSTKNQNLIDIIGDDAKVKTYINIKNREILIKDLISIINLDEKQTLSYLNSVNYPWKYDSYKKTWINSEKNLLVVKNEKNSISYLSATYNPMNINEELKQLNFNKIDTLNSKKLSAGEKIKQSMLINEGIYTNKNYDVIIKAPYVNGTIALVINVQKKQ